MRERSRPVGLPNFHVASTTNNAKTAPLSSRTTTATHAAHRSALAVISQITRGPSITLVGYSSKIPSLALTQAVLHPPGSMVLARRPTSARRLRHFCVRSSGYGRTQRSPAEPRQSFLGGEFGATTVSVSDCDDRDLQSGRVSAISIQIYIITPEPAGGLFGNTISFSPHEAGDGCALFWKFGIVLTNSRSRSDTARRDAERPAQYVPTETVGTSGQASLLLFPRSRRANKQAGHAHSQEQ
jgi:hypothetical protein